MSKIGLILEREFVERARKKSFIITTLLTPILMIGLMVAPSLIMFLGSTPTKSVVVVDETHEQIIGSKLESNETVSFNLLEAGITPGQARAKYNNADQAYGVLIIGSDIVDNPSNIQLILNDASSINVEERIKNQVQSILRTERLSRYDLENMDQILADANVRIGNLSTLKNNGEETNEENMEQTSTAASYIMGIVLGMMLYLILIVYGSQVLQSVINEKQSRVLDVMVTSCTPFDLMMGKILGMALVAGLQIIIWAVLVIGASAFLLPLLQGGTDPSATAAAMQAISDPELASIIGNLTNVGYLITLFCELLLYIVGGFLFYAAIYAAIGSAVDNPQDAGQFTFIVMMPVILAIMVMMSIANDPNSGLVFWCSMIPFTSPVVMMARIPFGVPAWQVVTSVIILYLSFILMTWLAGRIFRVGVFMHGKKPSWKDLGAWIMMK